MSGLLFGTGGIPHSSSGRSTVDGIKRIAELGLGGMEVEFVQGVKMSEESARMVAETALGRGIRLSAHAPYYINFNAHEPEKISASQNRLLQAARIAALCKAQTVVFHTAFYMGDLPAKVYETIKKNLGEVVEQLKQDKNPVWLRPEVMGKHSEFGTLDEIFTLCSEMEGVDPAIDFAHWHARSGINTYPQFVGVLNKLEKRLGRRALDNMHMHISGIRYSDKGEISHLNLKESDFQFTELLKALRDYDAKGLVICESPNLEEDALLLQTTYNTL